MKYFLALVLTIIASNSLAQSECNEVIITNNNIIKASYKIKQANTPESRKTGLMYIKQMPDNQGMLFTWENPDFKAMWMKNTYIPLDMLFINDNKVLGLAQNTIPLSLKPIYIKQPVNQILEINANQINKNGISIGDTIKCIKI